MTTQALGYEKTRQSVFIKEVVTVLLASLIIALFTNCRIFLPFSPVPIALQPHIILLLGVVKVLGLISIWLSKSRLLKEWTYAGFVFVLVLGVIAHIAINDNEYAPALISLILVVTSYVFNRKEQLSVVS